MKPRHPSRPPPAPGRRRFLKLSIGALPMLAAGCGDSSSGSSHDVAIVGAGLAGLAAADALLARGYRVIVLEAANHVGGRTVTDNATFALHGVDLGAQFFHQAEHNPLARKFHQQADRLGLQRLSSS